MSNVLITLTGPSCGGKTTLARKLVEAGCNEIVSFTTRPRRAKEVDGLDYYFLATEQVEKYIKEEEFVEKVNFQGNYYGILAKEIQHKVVEAEAVATVVVLEPHGVEQIQKYAEEKGIEVLSVYIGCKEQTLVERFLDRYAGDKNARPDIYAKRLLNALKVERNWQMDYTYLFETFFPGFGPDNEEYVINMIEGKLEAIRIVKEIEAKREEGVDKFTLTVKIND